MADRKTKGANVKQLVYTALMTAVIAVLSQIQIPLPGLVPLSLATFGVMMAGLLLGWKRGAVSAAVYLLLGAVGVPVFAGFKGGVSALLGPTGGYLIGYLPYAMLAGIPMLGSRDGFFARCVSLLLGTLICYALGTAWFVHQTGRTLYESLGICVLPFLPGDAAKIILASLLAPRLQKVMKEN
ncbi:MAG: biotin transporter BioY [Clostridia bacterium]|nr:biotin transporter BioY [Clostridia bacterium]